jgi:hypothetical protein
VKEWQYYGIDISLRQQFQGRVHRWMKESMEVRVAYALIDYETHSNRPFMSQNRMCN